MKLKPVYNKKFAQAKLCHDQWCNYGETSVVAHILTSFSPEQDMAWAEKIAKRWNAVEDFEAKIMEAHAAVTPKATLGDDDSIHPTDKQEGHREGLLAALKIMEGLTA